MEKYVCMYCGKEYTNYQSRDKCLDSHDLIYVPIPKGDLNRLLNYIISGNTAYLTEEMVEHLFKYVRK